MAFDPRQERSGEDRITMRTRAAMTGGENEAGCHGPPSVLRRVDHPYGVVDLHLTFRQSWLEPPVKQRAVRMP
jgi:hypothetical protein